MTNCGVSWETRSERHIVEKMPPALLDSKDRETMTANDLVRNCMKVVVSRHLPTRVDPPLTTQGAHCRGSRAGVEDDATMGLR